MLPPAESPRLSAIQAELDAMAARQGLGFDTAQPAVEALAAGLELEAPQMPEASAVAEDVAAEGVPAPAQPETIFQLQAEAPVPTETRSSRIAAKTRSAAARGMDVARKVAENPRARKVIRQVGTSAAKGALSSIGVIAEKSADGRLEPKFHDPTALKGRKTKEILKSVTTAAGEEVKRDAPEIVSGAIEDYNRK